MAASTGLNLRVEEVAVAQLPPWVPSGVDVTVPNAARVYDCALGGYHNFQVDREFLDEAERAMPGVRQLARANRAFLGRAVRWLVGSGITQFLDIGSGIPTLGSVHEVAQRANPHARVGYVDIDPIAVAHGRMILADNPYATAVAGDLHRPEAILDHPEVAQLLDLTQPVAVLLIAVLHFVPDSADPAGIVARIADRIAPGSFVAVSHGIPMPAADRQAGQEAVRQLYERTPTPVVLRTVEQVSALFDGLDVVDPGLVPAAQWHPDPDAGELVQDGIVVGVARRP